MHTIQKILCTFPGQGSQFIGMGKELRDAFACAREVFQEVDDALDQHLSTLMFTGDIDQLNLTENTQPAIMAVSIAVWRVLHNQFNLTSDQIYAFAGHSLGEYSAFTAAGVFALKDTAKLLRLRGHAMQTAVPVNQGSMAAILGLSIESVDELCKQAAQNDICEVANDNCVGQVVISGHTPAIMRAIEQSKHIGAKKSILLPVSAPFHSSLMQGAEKSIQEHLQQTPMSDAHIPIYTNVSAQAHTKQSVLQEHLVSQVTGKVRWRETIDSITEEHVNYILELGPGSVLTGLAKRIKPQINRFNLHSPHEIEEFISHYTKD